MNRPAVERWIQVSVEVAAAEVDTVDGIFCDHGALSVTVDDAADDPVYEPLPGELRHWRENRVTGLFPDDLAVAPLRQALVGRLGAGPAAWRVETVEDRDWERCWLDHFKPLQCGPRLWICPSSEPPPRPDAVNVLLDPGLAFGTGSHPTTALCLGWLDRAMPAGTMLDFGCGSGILAIAALRLGCAHAWAVDIDPQALLATGDNARRNGVDDRLTVCPPAELPDDLAAELVVANILAGPLIELAGSLSDRVARGGRLALSGLLPEQADAVSAAYRPWFGELERRQRDGWCLLAGERR